ASDLATARAELDAALALTDGRPDASALAQAAALALKAGDAETGEARRTQAIAASPAAAAYVLAAEAARLKLPKPLNQRFDHESAAAVAAPPAAHAAAALLAAYHDQERGGTYLGQKTHAKKVQTFAEAALKADAAEADVVRLCERLRDLRWWPVLKKATARG